MSIEHPMDRPGERRFFIHKRLLRGAGAFLTGGPIAAASGFLAPVRRTVPRTSTARPSTFSESEKAAGRALKFGPGRGRRAGLQSFTNKNTGEVVQQAGRMTLGPDWLPGVIDIIRGGGRGSGGLASADCVWPTRRDPRTGKCAVFAGQQSGIDPTPVGDAVMGQYGAGLVPGNRPIDRAVCVRGMVLGNDGICYNRSQIKNADRMWPKGRRPLLTGGDMRAISTAARAGRRLEGATKRLQKIGLMKKPAPRRKAITSGPTEHHHH